MVVPRTKTNDQEVLRVSVLSGRTYNKDKGPGGVGRVWGGGGLVVAPSIKTKRPGGVERDWA